MTTATPTRPRSRAQAGTAQAGTVQAGTVQTGTVQTGTVQTGTVQTGTVQAGTVQTGGVVVLASRDLPRRPPADLLAAARHGLAEAAAAQRPAERYALAHLAALRAAAAVLAVRARPAPAGQVRRGRPASAWLLLTGVAPELAEWASFFAAGAGKRAAAESGAPGAVTPREADDLLRDAEVFLCAVTVSLGDVHQPALPAQPAQSAQPGPTGTP